MVREDKAERPAALLQLASNVLSYGPEPCEGEEVGQTLRLTAAGEVTLERRYYVRGMADERIKSSTKHIAVQAATALSEELAAIFAQDSLLTAFATDVGTWELQLLGAMGGAKIYQGSVVPLASGDPLRQWEVKARRVLRFKRLFLFDGGHYMYRTCADLL